MFQTGDRVVYGNNGICCIERIGVPDFEVFECGKQYYFLRCEEDGSRIYVPLDTRVAMRAILTPAEAQALLHKLPAMPVQHPASRDHKLVTQHYQKLLQQHSAESLACTVKSIHLRSKGADGAPGRISSAEESILKKTEAQLCSELAAALGISPASAHERLLAAIRGKNKETE